MVQAPETRDPDILRDGALGPLRLDRSQGRSGGQGSVYPATTSTGARVAVKIAHAGPGARQSLLAEGEALKAVHARDPEARHWLVPLLGQGETEDGRPYLVLEWFNDSFSSWLGAEDRPLLQRLDAMIRASEAVCRLHWNDRDPSRVLVHRDLKFGNFLVQEMEGSSLRVVLADLGGAKDRHLLSQTVNTGLLTPGYAPLEQALPIAQKQDPSVDVHALGVMLFKALTRYLPVSTQSRVSQLNEKGQRLLDLVQASRRTIAEETELANLKQLGVADLLDLDAAVALLPQDRQRLVNSFSTELEEQVEDPVALSRSLLEPVLSELEKALSPDPSARLDHPRRLLAVTRQLREALEPHLGGVEPGRPPPSPAAEAEPTSRTTWTAPSISLPSRRGWRQGLLFLGMVGVMVLVVVSWPERQVSPISDRSSPVAPGPVKELVQDDEAADIGQEFIDPEPAPAPSRPRASASRKRPSPAPQSTGGSSPPPVRPEAAPRLKFRSDYNADARLMLDGRDITEDAKRGRAEIAPGEHRLDVLLPGEPPRRSYRLSISADDETHWRIQGADAAGLQLGSGGLLYLHWARSGSISLGPR